MTARVDPTFKVPVSLEPTVSYFSQYPAIVSRSIWDPLAPGVLGGAKDLAGRAVIIATVLLVGYLFLALVSRYFGRTTPPPLVGLSIEDLCGPKNTDDMCTALHSHCQSTDHLPQEKILQLCDVENLKEAECLYTEDLSFEKKQIQLLIEDSKTQPLLEYIKKETTSPKDALGALFVLLGIKPALVMDKVWDEELISIVKNLAQGDLQWKETTGRLGFREAYFVNEKPFSFFNPREFLNLRSDVSLTEVVALCFSKQDQRDADQYLSYLLGFGPSWEAYAINTDYFSREQKLKEQFLREKKTELHSVSCIFNKNHYYEIGKVLNQALFEKDEVRSEIEKLGFTFHSQFASLLKHGHWLKENSDLKDGVVAEMLSKTGTSYLFDGLTARTDYFKKSYTLKKWVMETYFSQLL